MFFLVTISFHFKLCITLSFVIYFYVNQLLNYFIINAIGTVYGAWIACIAVTILLTILLLDVTQVSVFCQSQYLFYNYKDVISYRVVRVPLLLSLPHAGYQWARVCPSFGRASHSSHDVARTLRRRTNV